MTELAASLGLAAGLWVFAFRWQPVGFWASMALAAALLGSVGLARAWPSLRGGEVARPAAADLAWGAATAAALAAAFHAGGAILRRAFPGAGPLIAAVYGMDTAAPLPAIAAALLLVIGPGEELFWRVFLQQRMAQRWGPARGWAWATLAYAAVHLVTANPVLVLAALVAGGFWGLMWWRRPRLWGVVVSHALWDVIMFVLWPA